MPDVTKSLTAFEITDLEALLGPSNDRNYSLVELDGFFHGLLCLPRAVMPSEWFEEVLPDSVMTQKRAERALELILRYYNRVNAHVLEGSFRLRCDDSGEQCITWLEGFARAFAFQEEALEWLADAEADELGSDENVPISGLILSFGLDFERIDASGGILDSELDEDAAAMRRAREKTRAAFMTDGFGDNLGFLTGVASEVHRLLEPARSRRPEHAYGPGVRAVFGGGEPYRRAQAKVGRNDPCPCGSGRKYKHCHGRNARA